MSTHNTNRRILLKGAAAFGMMTSAAPFMAHANQSKTLKAAISGFNVVNTLDPGKATLIPEFYLIYGMFNGLIGFDSLMNQQPELASSWHIENNGTLQFKLRRDVKFHNGDQMTADDVAFTLERILDSDYASPNKSKIDAISRIEIINPHTINIHTKHAFAPLLNFLGSARSGTQIVSKRAVQEMGDIAFGRAPVGTGAYQLKTWDTGQKLVLNAHRDHFAGTPAYETVETLLIAEESSGVTALLGGQIDLASNAPFADVPSLEKNANVTVHKQPGLNTRFININMRKEPCNNVHFRRALSMAFSRDAMVQAVLFGEGVVSHGFIPPSLEQYYHKEPREYTTFNPERARAEFAKSGVDKSMRIPVMTWGAGWWKRIGEVFVTQVNATLGTNLILEVTDPNAAYSRQQSGDFMLAVWGWIGMIDPDEYLGEQFHSKKSWRNLGGYSNPELDTLLDQGASTLDITERKALYKQAEDIAISDVAAITCFYSNIHSLTTSKITGFQQKPYANFADQFANIKLA